MPKIKNGLKGPLKMRHIAPLGELEFPVTPGRPFANLVAKTLPTESTSHEMAAALPPEANIEYDEEASTLSAAVPGMLRDGKMGLRIDPLWTVTDDTLLTVDIYPRDCFGAVLAAKKLVEGLHSHVGEVQVDIDRFEQSLLESKSRNEILEKVVLAQGEPAKHGRPGKAKTTIEVKKSAGSVQGDGSVDFRERKTHASVAQGDTLAELTPPTKGIPGKDIFGNTLDAEEGAPVDLIPGQNILQETDKDGFVVFKAAIQGVAILSGNTITVSDVIEIDSDVDIASGNVHAESGSVHITGTVTTGSTVTAKENVLVDTVVESADIQAGGDLIVAGGIFMDEGTCIEVGGNVQAHFLRNATIRAGGDIIVEADIVNCDIQAGGKVIAASEKGAISGGTVTCGKGLDAMEIGSDINIPTTVKIQPTEDEFADITKERNRVQDRLDQLGKLIGTDETTKPILLAPEEDKRILLELFKIRSGLKNEMDILEESRQAALEGQKEALAKIHIRARKTIHPKTTIVIGGKSITLAKPESATQLNWDPEKGGIAIKGL
jgi:uncharacterized protein